jgi:hypothetical protein
MKFARLTEMKFSSKYDYETKKSEYTWTEVGPCLVNLEKVMMIQPHQIDPAYTTIDCGSFSDDGSNLITVKESVAEIIEKHIIPLERGK